MGTMRKQERNITLGVRVSERDRRAIEKAAEDAQMTVSDFIRAATLAYMAFSLNPDGLRMLARGLANTIEEGISKFQRKKADRKLQS